MITAHFHGGPCDGHECDAPLLPVDMYLGKGDKRSHYVLHHTDAAGLKHYYYSPFPPARPQVAARHLRR